MENKFESIKGYKVIKDVVEGDEKPKKSTRSRRPNRNTQKKPRTTKKSTRIN